MLLEDLAKKGVITPPKFLLKNTALLVQMGSEAYGVSSGQSDIDVYGFGIPYKDDVFPHLRGEIQGFGTEKERFSCWQQHHCKTDNEREYDFCIYGIVKFFNLAMRSSPPILDALFVPRRCVLFSTEVGEMVRENRKMFLSRQAWAPYKGYAFKNFNRYRDAEKRPSVIDFRKFQDAHGIDRDILDADQTDLSEQDRIAFASLINSLPKRDLDALRLGYDSKAMYHVVRNLAEIEQILVEHDLDLERNREQLKSIRRGEWSIKRVEDFFHAKEKQIEEIYAKSTLRVRPDEDAIRTLLLNCLEHHYGSLSGAVERDPSAQMILSDLALILDRYRF